MRKRENGENGAALSYRRKKVETKNHSVYWDDFCANRENDVFSPVLVGFRYPPPSVRLRTHVVLFFVPPCCNL